ncbi:MAG: signal peptide peptidase SppA [Anaerolineales bacterium]|nr:signal peptide peptidase SppA [Anaerolineales bacterium]
MQTNPTNPANRSPWWALGGAAFGFLLPFVGFGCIAALCIFSFAGMNALSATGAPATSSVHLSGPLSGPAVAVIDINGEIVSGSSASLGMSSLASSGDILPLVAQAAAAGDVKAILLRINSPGGSVVPSDEIYHALKGCGKPIVVLMGEMAASGGYYISMAAEHLVANPNTLTGSIGVISSFPEASELMKNLGVTVSVIKSGSVKDIGSLYRPMTAQEMALWQKVVDETYESFVQIVAEGRKMSIEQVHALADGSVYTGRQALELGLIDALGYQEDALLKAAELGAITGTPRVILLAPPAVSLFSSLLSGRMNQSLIPEDFLGDLLAPKLEYRWTGQ